MHDTVSVDHLVKAMERIGNRHSSLSNQKREIAMMVGGTEESDGGGGAVSRSRRQCETALVAAKKPKFGRCKFHDHSSCKYGERCRFNHVGEAGNGHPPPVGHSVPQSHVPQPAAAEADANAESKDDGDAGEEDDDDDDDSDGSDNDSDEGSDDDEGGSEEEESDEDEAKG